MHCVSFMYGAPHDSPKPSEVASSGSKFARAWCEQLQHRLSQIEDVCVGILYFAGWIDKPFRNSHPSLVHCRLFFRVHEFCL